MVKCNFKRLLLAIWPSGNAHRLQTVRNGFDSWLEAIVFGIYTLWRVAIDTMSANSLRSVPQSIEFFFRYNLYIFDY